MADRKSISRKRGQAARLSAQHLQAGGVAGIFGREAQTHETSVKEVAERVLLLLRQEFPKLNFRLRGSIRKQEIHDKLKRIDPQLGVKLFVPTATIRPDGGITEVLDKNGEWRVVLVGEAKHQGNDVQNILSPAFVMIRFRLATLRRSVVGCRRFCEASLTSVFSFAGLSSKGLPNRSYGEERATHHARRQCY